MTTEREEFEKIWAESVFDSSNNRGDKLWSWHQQSVEKAVGKEMGRVRRLLPSANDGGYHISQFQELKNSINNIHKLVCSNGCIQESPTPPQLKVDEKKFVGITKYDTSDSTDTSEFMPSVKITK